MGHHFMFTCSFCGKDNYEINHLIVGPEISICNECVETCNEIIKEEQENKIRIAQQVLLYKEFWGTDI